jgi:hypothetical protein
MDDDANDPSNDESPGSSLLADERTDPYADPSVGDVPVG